MLAGEEVAGGVDARQYYGDGQEGEQNAVAGGDQDPQRDTKLEHGQQGGEPGKLALYGAVAVGSATV